MSRPFLVLTAFASLVLSPTLVPAQNEPAPPPAERNNEGDRGERGDRGDRGDRGNFDPAQFRQRMEERMKEQLGVNDEEWKVLQPKLDKVMEARRESSGFGGAFGRGLTGGPGGRGGDDSNRQRSSTEQASRELRELLENKDASADQITAKLTALRTAREKARTNLQTAQKDLKEILTQRQEAVLVTMGMLE